jgi:hypothetical protein
LSIIWVIKKLCSPLFPAHLPKRRKKKRQKRKKKALNQGGVEGLSRFLVKKYYPNKQSTAKRKRGWRFFHQNFV